MEALSDALRFELAPWNIQVSLIEPGGVQTPIWKKSEASALAAMEAAGDRITPLYGTQLAALQEGAAKVANMAIPVSRVADVVEHALTARRPKTRYLVGFDARVQAWVRAWLPDRWRDTAVRIAMKIPAKPSGKQG
jgi:short-subunit dehydrogenase